MTRTVALRSEAASPAIGRLAVGSGVAAALQPIEDQQKILRLADVELERGPDDVRSRLIQVRRDLIDARHEVGREPRRCARLARTSPPPHEADELAPPRVTHELFSHQAAWSRANAERL